MTLLAKMQKKDQLLGAPSSVGTHNSAPVDEGRKMKGTYRGGEGEGGSGMRPPGSELLLGRRARVVRGSRGLDYAS